MIIYMSLFDFFVSAKFYFLYTLHLFGLVNPCYIPGCSISYNLKAQTCKDRISCVSFSFFLRSINIRDNCFSR